MIKPDIEKIKAYYRNLGPESFTHRIGDVTFGRSDCHPNTKIDEEHFVLDLYPIHLPFEETEAANDEEPEM